MSVAGTSIPSARAVCMLITNSNAVGRCTGISAGFSPLRILAGIQADQPIALRIARAVTHQSAGGGEIAQWKYGGQPVTCSECRELAAPIVEHRVGRDHKRVHLFLKSQAQRKRRRYRRHDLDQHTAGQGGGANVIRRRVGGERIGRIDQQPDLLGLRAQLQKESEPLGAELCNHGADSGDVVARAIVAGDEARLHRVLPHRENDRDRGGRGLGRLRGCGADRRYDDRHLTAHEVGCQLGHTSSVVMGPAIFDRDVAAFDVAGISPRPLRKASSRWKRLAGALAWRKPITGTADCCACASSGNPAAEPATTFMNSRRRIAFPKARDRAA